MTAPPRRERQPGAGGPAAVCSDLLNLEIEIEIVSNIIHNEQAKTGLNLVPFAILDKL